MQQTTRSFQLFVALFVLSILIFIIIPLPEKFPTNLFERKYKVEHVLDKYLNGRWRQFNTLQILHLSRLGRILYLDEKFPKNTPKKNYTILIWKDGYKYEGIYPKHRVNKRHEPFEFCPVQNCNLTFNQKDFPLADIIIFNLNEVYELEDFPKNLTRNPHQIWAFFTIESPLSLYTTYPLIELNNLFNWSMTYRSDSDIPVPYGRTIVLNSGALYNMQSYTEWNSQKLQDILIAIVISNCQGRNHYWNYITLLKKYIPVHIYGNCGFQQCKSDFVFSKTKSVNDCNEISKYKFYLAFEDSNCDEYITEKLWWYGFAKNTIPIVMGGRRSYYDYLLPPYSFLHVENFAHPRDLVNYVMYLNRTPTDIWQYFEWKKHFKVINEHGYFNTSLVRYCRICQALNYNKKNSKSYSDLNGFLKSGKCQSPWNFY